MHTTVRTRLTTCSLAATTAITAAATPIFAGTAVHEVTLSRAGDTTTLAEFFLLLTAMTGLVLWVAAHSLWRRLRPSTNPAPAAATDTLRNRRAVGPEEVYDQERDHRPLGRRLSSV